MSLERNAGVQLVKSRLTSFNADEVNRLNFSIYFDTVFVEHTRTWMAMDFNMASVILNF